MINNKIKIILFLLIILCMNNLYRKFLYYEKEYQSILDNPKISVIIPVFNGVKYLKNCLKSVQNQKMKNIEILIIDDNSHDDSSKIIHKYMDKDKRIRLIHNKENRKILFSKSMGALFAKGKYIIEIDQDDKFLKKNSFNLLYTKAEKYQLDILHFNMIAGKNFFNSLKIYNSGLNFSIENQPQIKFRLFKTNFSLLWGNLIKADLYKKVLYNLWPIIINYKIIFQEDFIIIFFLFIYAKKFLNINKLLYFYYINRQSASNDFRNNNEFYLCLIFTGIIYYDYYIDFHSDDFKIIINYIYSYKSFFNIVKNSYNSLFNYFFRKIMFNKYLSNQDKNNLIIYFNISENFGSDSYLTKNVYNIFEDLSTKKLFFHNKNFNSLELSIIIIFSNYEKTLRLINSIFFQCFDNFEIILINDDENKNSFQLLCHYIKTYKNFKLINNEIKKGILFSIVQGLFLAKGKYIMFLDQNYFFLNKMSFHNIFEEIKNDDIDILEFNLYKIQFNNSIDLYRCKHYKSQFNLTSIKYNLEFNDIDIKDDLLTNKLFNSKFLKNIFSHFKLNGIHEIVDYYYNKIISFLLETYPSKFKRINSVSIYICETDIEKHKLNEFKSINYKYINETIFYINFIFDNSKDTIEIKEKILKEFFNILSIIFNKFTKISNSANKLLNKFLQCNYISKFNKNLLIFYYHSLIT